MSGTKSPSYNYLLSLEINSLLPILSALHEVGFTPETMERISKDKIFASLLGEIVANFGIPNIPDNEAILAQQLDYWGVRAWSEAFWVYLTENQLKKFPTFPWPLELLNEPCQFSTRLGKCRGERRELYIPICETHRIFLGLDKVGRKPLTMKQMQRLALKHKRGYQSASDKIGTSNFFNTEVAQFRWYMIYHSSLYDSGNKTYEEQLTMLPQEYENPSAIELAQCRYLCSDSHVWFNPEVVRTKTTSPISGQDECRITLGGDSSFDFGIGYVPDDNLQADHIKIAASRLPGK